jgi:ceramide glucosyltransferase
VLFGVADPNDPVIELIHQLQQKFSRLSIRLFVAELLGTNPKAASLHALTARARGEVLVICDSDIRVTDDFLSRVVQPLCDPSIGLVTCLYRGESPGNLPARLEALHMDASFAPSVALAWKMGTDVGLGATVVMRCEDLCRAGGYAGCADHLLDDYEIAARIARLGLRIHLSDYPVASVLGAERFAQQWKREVRWSRGIRAVNPLRYPEMAVTFSIPLALLAAAFSAVWPWAWVALPISIAVRTFVGWQAARALGQRERRYLVWLPLRDFLSMAVWCFAMFGRTVVWRGRRFTLGRDGKLEPPSESRLRTGPLARSVRRLDAYLRRRQRIFEFTENPRCILRANVMPAKHDIEFPDGTVVHANSPVAILHLWNEHLPTIPPEGPDLRWAMELRKSLLFSLRQLARAARYDPRLASAQAFGGPANFVSRGGVVQVARMAARYGFDSLPPAAGANTLGQRIHDYFEDFLVLGLQWAFNPVSLRGKSLHRPRESLWMTRKELLQRYNAPPARMIRAQKLIAAHD